MNNFAPSVSIAWRPDVQDGFWRTLLGDPNQATVRAGYSEAYDRAGVDDVHRPLSAATAAAPSR